MGRTVARKTRPQVRELVKDKKEQERKDKVAERSKQHLQAAVK